MIRRLASLAATALLLACQARAAAPAPGVPLSDLARRLEWVGTIVAEPEWSVWCASPIRDDDGRVHLFVSRWRSEGVVPGWYTHGEIARYVADRPEGPYRFAETVVSGTGRTGEWNAFAPHNPEIRRFGNRYALAYIANANPRSGWPRNQSTGLLLADRPEGPWTPATADGSILRSSPDPAHFTHGMQVVNPSLIGVGGKFHLYFKSGSPRRGEVLFGLAIADRLEGPYAMAPAPISPRGIWIEDGYAFVRDGKVNLLTTDNKGAVTGIPGAGILWVSNDGGLTFPPAQATLGFHPIPVYLPGFRQLPARHVYGNHPKLERPKLLLDPRGEPEFLFASSGCALDGRRHTSVHLLRVAPKPVR